MPRHVAVVVKGYPRLSETFIAQEILALQRRGLRMTIVSLRHPTDERRHALHDAIDAPVLYLPEYLIDDPRRVLRGLLKCAPRPHFKMVLAAWLRDFRRDVTANRVRRLGQALTLAAELPDDVDWLHVHYLHTPGSVARYAALLRGLPFSMSAHAKDVWTIPEWEKVEKLQAAAWAVTCSRINLDHLRQLVPKVDLELLYHGLDLSAFPAPSRVRGSDEPFRIVTVARAVEKKGLDLLVEALAQLPTAIDWRFDHIGGGPMMAALRAQAVRLGIADRITWLGPGTRADVLAVLRRSDLFVLPSRVAADGDRDGLPNVIMEAMSQELPVVATKAGAIPEVVQDQVTGLLVDENDPAGLAKAIAELALDPQRRIGMGREGRRRVVDNFRFERSIDRLALRFGLTAQTDIAA